MKYKISIALKQIGTIPLLYRFYYNLFLYTQSNIQETEI